MSTIIVAAILIISTILIFLIFIYINKKNERDRNETFLTLFSKAGTKYGLSFSSQQILRNKIIGLDGLQNKLLMYQFENNNIICIDLAKVKSCTVTKEYDSVNMGTEKKSKIEKQLRSININFDFKSSLQPVAIPFYDSNINSIYEMAPLNAKAEDWQILLSKLLLKEHKARA